METNSTSDLTVYVRSYTIGTRNVHIRTCYLLLGSVEVASEISKSIQLPVEMPFEITVKCVSMLCKNISKLYVGEDFAIMPTIKSSSPWDIEIVGTWVELVLEKNIFH